MYMFMEKKELRIIFMGTPEFAVGTLKALVEGGYNVVAVVTQPDKPVGRHGSVLQPSQVKQYALEHNLPVLQPVKMKDPDFVEELRSYNADLQVVVAFRMLPEVVWAMPRFGTFNVHAALLPQYRGAAPINWAIINGETQTGVTTFFLDHDIDTGRIIMQDKHDIDLDDNVENVYDALMVKGANLALSTINKIIEGEGSVPTMAQEELTHEDLQLHEAPKLFKENCRIDWNKSPKQIHDFVRGLSPIPGAWTELIGNDGKTQILKIYKTSSSTLKDCEDEVRPYVEGKKLFIGGVEVLELQLSGKKRIRAIDFLNGMKNISDFSVK